MRSLDRRPEARRAKSSIGSIPTIGGTLAKEILLIDRKSPHSKFRKGLLPLYVYMRYTTAVAAIPSIILYPSDEKGRLSRKERKIIPVSEIKDNDEDIAYMIDNRGPSILVTVTDGIRAGDQPILYRFDGVTRGLVRDILKADTKLKRDQIEIIVRSPEVFDEYGWEGAYNGSESEYETGVKVI